MKKFFLIGTMLIFSVLANAQIHDHAIGLRAGGGSVSGAEISYQHALSNVNRLEFDLGFSSGKAHNVFALAGIYQWLWNIEKGFNWYAGPGAIIGMYSYKNADDGLNIGIGGQIGIEYDFNHLNAPILVSLDLRPMIDLVGSHSGLGWGAGLGIRYTW